MKGGSARCAAPSGLVDMTMEGYENPSDGQRLSDTLGSVVYIA
jgi:hypothetical protein